MTAATTLAPEPRVWAMMGHKAGDNSQILALAEGLGWPFETKHLVYRPTELLTNRLAPRTLLGIVRRRSSPLVPPWPDLIISAGRRNEPAGRWIQAQADRRVRLVHCGRPWASLDCFDLVVTTPQYRLPERPNVLHNTTPLQQVSEARLEAARALWGPRLARLPRPAHRGHGRRRRRALRARPRGRGAARAGGERSGDPAGRLAAGHDQRAHAPGTDRCARGLARRVPPRSSAGRRIGRPTTPISAIWRSRTPSS